MPRTRQAEGRRSRADYSRVHQEPATDVRCESCGALISMAGAERTARCPFCDTPSVVTRPAGRVTPQPAYALGFAVDRDTAIEAVGRWIGRRRMAPLGLRRSVVERVSGIYLPVYLYSASARSHYRASIAETYRRIRFRKDGEGGVTLGSRDETEYRDLTGRHVTYVTDVLVTASRTVTNEELKAIEPFDFGRLRRYSPALIAGWTWEEPSLSPNDCVRLARADAEALVADALRNFMPGDGVAELRHDIEFQDDSFDQMLVPVWVCTVRHDAWKAPVRMLVNGQTGKVGGAIPFSWMKLAAMIALGAALLAVSVTVLSLLAWYWPC